MREAQVIKLPLLVKNRRAIAKQIGEKYRIKRISRLQHPIAQEVEYAKFLKSIAQFTTKQIKTILFPRIPYLIRSATATRTDAYTDDLNEIFRTIQATVGEQFTEEQIRHAIKARGLSIADWNRKQMTRILSSALSVDVYTSEPWLLTELNGFVHTNVGLIESIPRDQLREAELRVGQAIRQGLRVGEIEAQIEGEFGVNKKAVNRAELIARDQVGKFNGDLNHLRQTELGIEKYKWRTVRDERVRPFHADLEGTIHRWDEPPVVSRDGRRAHPGEDYQCRCQAEPILDF
jgi:SPP1 gp7 family putative phage head morphogenesis protein